MDCSYRRILIGLVISALIFMIIVIQCDDILHGTRCPWIVGISPPSHKTTLLVKKDQAQSHGKVLQEDTPRHRLPDAIIIGAKKAGTRALIRFLRLHPNISAAGPEIHFFDRSFAKGYNWYLEQMPLSKAHQIVIEKTPRYLITESAPKNIYRMNPNIKLIVILRDPVRRAISDYTQGYQKHAEEKIKKNFKTFKQHVMLKDGKTIKEESQLINVGLYVNHLKRWLNVFRRDQIHIVSGEGLVKNPADELFEVQRFLGISIHIDKNSFIYSKNKTFYCIKVVKTSKPACLDGRKGRKHVEIDANVLKTLYDFYTPYNEKLFQLIGKKFDWRNR